MGRQPYTCPHCGGKRYKSLRKGGITRCCGKKVIRVNGAIYKCKEDAPEWQVISKFIEMKHGRGFTGYEIPFRSSHYREILKSVNELIYERCRGDLELALLVVELSFTHDAHKWRNYASFYSVMSRRFLPDVIAKAKIVMAKQRAENETEARTRELTLPLDVQTLG